MDRQMLQRLTMGTVVLAVIVLAAILFVPQLRGAGGGGGSVNTGTLDLDAQPALGDPDAPVEIVLFEDFRCPSCASFTEQVFPELEQEFVREGVARVYFVNFPVLGPPSRHVALVTECVAAQSEDAFWELKSPLMRSQGQLEDRDRVYELVSTYAPGVDVDEVRTCVDENRQADRLDAEIQAANGLGVNATPTVMVDGERVNPTMAAIRDAVARAAE